MASLLVDRATNDQLIGADWAMNIEICDILNRDPGQTKDVVKGIKRRLGSKNSKVQLLALSLLETLIKNCGDVVHMHVVERDVLHEMIKIVKKKHPDLQVIEKILSLIDAWQDAFGGPRARYPQYYTAYQELLRLGADFPERSSRSAPIFAPPQTQPLSSYPQSIRSPDYQKEAPETSTAFEFPSLSEKEIQNARGIMDVLAEMLNAMDPGNREELKQEVIVDLVDQCRTYNRRAVQLVNTTFDEELLCLGLALNDDLQKVLAKVDAIASGSVRVGKPKFPSLVDIDNSTASNRDAHSDQSTIKSQTPIPWLLVPAPSVPNGSSSTALVEADPFIDLLSGDKFSKSAAADNNNSSNPALVPVSKLVSLMSSDQNALAPFDMFPGENNNKKNSMTEPAATQMQTQQPFLYSNGNGAQNFGYEQTTYEQGAGSSSWSKQTQASYYSINCGNGALPPPPWESQPAEDQPATQMGGLDPQHSQSENYINTPPQPMQNPQHNTNTYPSPMVQNYPVGGTHPQAALYGSPMMMMGYGLNQQPNPQSLCNNQNGQFYPHNAPNTNSSYARVSALNRHSNPEDKLFGDLVSIAKSMPGKNGGISKVGSL